MRIMKILFIAMVVVMAGCSDKESSGNPYKKTENPEPFDVSPRR